MEDLGRQAMNLVSDLQNKMDQLMNIQKEAMKQLPAEEMAKLSFVSKDMNEIKKAIKKGDSSAIDQYIKKYANSNNK
jgi:hypothetical protein